MSVVLYSQNNKQLEMRFRAAKSMIFMQKVFGITMVFFVVVLYFIWLLTGMFINREYFFFIQRALFYGNKLLSSRPHF